MNITPQTSLRDLAFIISTKLTEAKLTAVLTGGGAAVIYAPESIQSYDLDFVFDFWSSLDPPEQPLLELGFQRKGDMYVHESVKFTLEFPEGPLSVGEQVVREWDVLTENGMTLNILKPIDCVKDRLMWYFGPSPDYAALAQAVAVTKKQNVDIDSLRTWSESIGEKKAFEFFLNRYEV